MLLVMLLAQLLMRLALLLTLLERLLKALLMPPLLLLPVLPTWLPDLPLTRPTRPAPLSRALVKPCRTLARRCRRTN